MIFNQAIECMPREEMVRLQNERIAVSVKHAYENVAHYRNMFDQIGLKPEDIRSIEDLPLVPFTVKEHMRENFPYGLFAVPMKDIIRLHASSGTTGTPTVVGYTRADIENWAEMIARIAGMAGATPDDIVQISFGYGLFTGAFGLHYGMEKLGAAVVPISSGNSERQINLMRQFGSTILVGTPSYALYLAEYMGKMGVTPNDLKLRLGMFGGEGHTEEMRAQIEARLGVFVTENYGLSEVIGPGVSGECECRRGHHINEDFFYPEIIDSVTGKVLPMGETGELVLTTLNRQSMPMLRYRTRDITYLIDEPCKCGRTLLRMAKVQGRNDDMLIIRGVNVFPSQIEGVLMSFADISPHYEIIVKREGAMDVLEVLIEVSNLSLVDHYASLSKLTDSIRAKLKSVLQIDAKVVIVEPQTLKRFEGKAKRVTDLR